MRPTLAIFLAVVCVACFSSPSWAQIDMACYERCARELRMRPDYCQSQCTQTQSHQSTPLPLPDEGYKPWGGAAGVEAGERRANQNAMELLQMQQLYLENQRRKQQIEQQQESRSERRYENSYSGGLSDMPRGNRSCETARDCAPDQNCRTIPNSGGGTVCR